MRILELATGNALEVDDGYGARLMEQGKAVPCPAPPPAADEPPKDGDGAKPAKGRRAHAGKQVKADVAEGADCG